MKNWIARLFKGAGEAAPAARSAPIPAAGAPVSAPVESTQPGGAPAIDLPFWRWLCDLPAGPSDSKEPGPAARLVLDEVARLARAPGEAAGLVPRVPEVIPRLLRSLREEGMSGAELARQVAQDPVLVAEVIREANSPFYRSSKPVRTVDAALLVLGQNGLRMLLARVAFRPIIGMQTGRSARLVAPRLWQHSERCARAGALLAPSLGADPFEAYLAGLMLDVGLIVVFRLIDQLQESGLAASGPAADAAPPQIPVVVTAFLAAARQLSARIALHWELPPPVAAAILVMDKAQAGALAQALRQADRLARLRLLLDHGAIDAGDALLADLGAAQERVFERIGPEAE